MDIKKAVGLKIKEFRAARGLTQADLADVIGRSVDTVSHLERGVSLPNFRTLELLSVELKVPMRSFFPSSDAELKSAKRASAIAQVEALINELQERDLETAIELLEVLVKSKKRSPRKRSVVKL
ncbi:MAG: helix-turn-helix transcriptional regulator [Parvibaculum sp.]